MNRTWKKRVRGAAAALIFAAALSGCGLSNQSNVTTLSVDEDGKLSHTIVESVGDETTAKELRQYIEEQISSGESLSASSSSDGDAGKIELKSCKISDGTATIELSYPSWKAYENFNQTTCFLGTLKEAKEQGYDFNVSLYDENGKLVTDKEDLTTRETEWKVLIIEEPMNVRVPDKILYTTSNMEVTGRLTASWKDDGESAESGSASASESVSASSASESVSASSGSDESVSASSGSDESVSASSGSDGNVSSASSAEKSASPTPAASAESGSGTDDGSDEISLFMPDDFEIAYIIFK
ncbi:MAG: hypothetical protein ACOYBC_06225 [Bilifractor sp.]|jgi:hypothetical protein